MLYCPKCQKTYQEQTRRFCADDSTRLLPAPSSGKSANQTGGIFTNAFSRAAAQQRKPEQTESAFLPPPAPAANDAGQSFQSGFLPPPTSKIFKSEARQEQPPPPAAVKISKPFADILNEIAGQFEKPETAVQKPLPRSIKTSEVPASQAILGDRKTNPTGRQAVSWENPEVLIGQTVKGRYLIVEKTGEDEIGIAYLAEDKIVENKKVSIRVLMDEDTDDYFTGKIFAEERVSLSHINHPNVAGVVDSGELPEGKPFVVTEYVDGKSVADTLRQTGQFNALRAARLIRQAGYALSDVHQSGVLHRNLTAGNTILSVSDNGTEIVKLTNFGVLRGKSGAGSFACQSPEQIEGKTATVAGEVYSLGVLAYQMLTNRLPFNAPTAKQMVKAQREGLTLLPTNLRLDIAPQVDEILEKALAFNPAARYPKTRDFGDAFFNAVTTAALWEDGAAENAEEIDIAADAGKTADALSETGEKFADTDAKAEAAPLNLIASPAAETVSADKFAGIERRAETTAAVGKATENPLWKRRSTDKAKTVGGNLVLTALFVALTIVSVLVLSYFLMYRPTETAIVQTPPAAAVSPSEITAPTVEIESPPPPRTIQPPPNTVYFENSKQNLKSEQAKSFLGFSLYYPKEWKQNDAKTNFLDISKNAPSGTPVEQILVSYYDSKGTFNTDTVLFPMLVKQTNATLKTIVPNYRQLSEGAKTVNNGWRAYEVKFEGAGKTANGEEIKLWGRRLFIPAARNGLKNGYVLTLLATSLSPDVKSVEDVGTKGELSTVLNTFEPNQNF